MFTLLIETQDVAQYPNLIARVLARGVSDEQTKLLVGGNILRVWGEAEQVAKKIQDGGEEPNEAYYEGRKWGALDGGLVPQMFPDNTKYP